MSNVDLKVCLYLFWGILQDSCVKWCEAESFGNITATYEFVGFCFGGKGRLE